MWGRRKDHIWGETKVDTHPDVGQVKEEPERAKMNSRLDTVRREEAKGCDSQGLMPRKV